VPEAIGVASVVAGKVLGMITIGSFIDAVVLGSAGALGGWLSKIIINYILTKIKNKPKV
jgi:hypothetical protein